MSSFRTYFDAGHAAYEQGDYQSALLYFQNALSRATASDAIASTHGWIGMCEYELGDYTEAASSFETELMYNPDDDSALVWWTAAVRREAIEFFEGRDFHAAIDNFACILQRVELDDPKKSWTHGWLGCCYLPLGEYRAAFDCYKEVLHLSPDDVNAREQLSYLLSCAPDATLRDGQAALQIVHSIIDEENPKWNHLTLKAAAHAELGDFDNAIALYEKAMAIMPPEQREMRWGTYKQLKSHRPIRSDIEENQRRLFNTPKDAAGGE